MAEETKPPREIEFFFEHDKDYQIVAANGAWVGNTSRGDITIDFFVERLGVPEKVRNAITQDGRLGEEIGPTREKRFTRQLQVGVLISAEVAENLVDLLKSRVENIKKIKRGEVMADLNAQISSGTSTFSLQIADAAGSVGYDFFDEVQVMASGFGRIFWEFEEDIPTQSEIEFQEQKRMFEDIPPLLLLNDYPGQFVISRNGRIADSDYDLDTLVERFFADHGDVPVYMTKIGGEIEELIDTPFFDE